MIRINCKERRIIYITIRSGDGQPFVIRDAEYELIRHQTSGEDATVDSGMCNIKGTQLSLIVSPEQPGLYEIKCSMTIAEERIIRKAYIQVQEA